MTADISQSEIDQLISGLPDFDKLLAENEAWEQEPKKPEEKPLDYYAQEVSKVNKSYSYYAHLYRRKDHADTYICGHCNIEMDKISILHGMDRKDYATYCSKCQFIKLIYTAHRHRGEWE